MTQDNNHAEIRELMGGYALGGLTEEEKARVERHLGECGECQMEYNGLLAMNQELMNVFEGVRAPKDLEDRASGAFLERASRVSILSITYWKGKIMNKPVIRKAAACVAAAILLGAVGKVAGSFIESGRLPMAAKMHAKAVAEDARMERETQLALKIPTHDFENTIEGVSVRPGERYAAGDGIWNFSYGHASMGTDDKSSSSGEPAMRLRGGQERPEGRSTVMSDEEWLKSKRDQSYGGRGDATIEHTGATADYSETAEEKLIVGRTMQKATEAGASGEMRHDAQKSEERPADAPRAGGAGTMGRDKELMDHLSELGNKLALDEQSGNGAQGNGRLEDRRNVLEAELEKKGGEGGVGYKNSSGQDMEKYARSMEEINGKTAGGYYQGGDGKSLFAVPPAPRFTAANAAVPPVTVIKTSDVSRGTIVGGGSLEVDGTSFAPLTAPGGIATKNTLKTFDDVKKEGTDGRYSEMDKKRIEAEALWAQDTMMLSEWGDTGKDQAGEGIQKKLNDKPAPDASYFKPVEGGKQGDKGVGAVDTDQDGVKDDVVAGKRVAMATETSKTPAAPAGGTKAPANGPGAVAAAAGETGGGGTSAPVSTTVQNAINQRKVIRNGSMEFEVESFDSGYVTVSQIVKEEGGYISGTNSEKLDNGKVRGTITVRVTPDHLDTLVMKLRGLGTLKSQKINAQDVTKDYYDMDSELRALRAMETRLIELIKTGKGEVKDLVEAEKQLGNYRVQIEKLEGSIRYYDSQVSLSTLTLTLMEKDIKAPAAVTSTEVVQMGCESEDVEKAAKQAVETIEKTFKGKIIESTLKKYDAGQYAANIVAEVEPDNVNALVDQIKLIGKVGRLDRELKQSSPAAEGAQLANTKVERKNTKLVLSIYNLANIAPRKTTNANIAVADVAGAYNEIVSMVSEKFSGRVVTSNLNRQKPEQTTATMTFEVPAEKAADALEAIKAGRDMMSMAVTENPDTQNVTAAKQGFSLRIYSTATVAARETQTITLATTRPVSEVFPTLEEKLGGIKAARVVSSQLNVQNKSNIFGSLDFEAPRLGRQDVEQALKDSGIYFNRTVSRSTDTENTIDSKMRWQVRVISMDTIPSRETRTLTVVTTRPVREAFNQLEEKIGKIEGKRVVSSAMNEQNPAALSGYLDVEVSKDLLNSVDQAVDEAGSVFSRSVSRSTDMDNTTDSKVHYQLLVKSLDSIQARETRQQTVATTKPVREAFSSLEEKIAKIDGKRVISSQLNENNPANIFGTMEVEVQRELGVEASKNAMAKLDQAIAEAGLMFDRSTTRSTNADGTIDSKVRYSLRLISQDVIPARESRMITAGVQDVNEAMGKLTAGVRKLGGRVMQSPITEGTGSRYSGLLEFEVPTERMEDAIRLIESNSAPYKRSTQESNDMKDTLDAKRRFVVGLVDMKNVPPSQRQSMLVSVGDVDKTVEEISGKVKGLGGRILDKNREAKSSQATYTLLVDIPLDKADELAAAVGRTGKNMGGTMSQDDSMPKTGPAARALFEVRISSAQGIIDDETGIFPSFKKAMGVSVRGLLWSLQMIVVGVLLIGPWAAAGWGVMKWRKRNKAGKPQA